MEEDSEAQRGLGYGRKNSFWPGLVAEGISGWGGVPAPLLYD